MDVRHVAQKELHHLMGSTSNGYSWRCDGENGESGLHPKLFEVEKLGLGPWD